MQQTLAQFDIFDGVDPELIEAFNIRCIWRSYDAGEMIIDTDEDTHEVRFVSSGTVRIVVRMLEGREVIFNDLEAGRFFGELAAIDSGPRSANVTALTNVQLCVMPQSVFKELCRLEPDFSWAVMNHLTGMVRALSERLSEFSFLKAKHRLYAELLRLSREREGDNIQRIISPSPLQSDIADRISSRREIVSREMKDLERRGILTRIRGGLVIEDSDALSALAAEGWLT